MGRAGGNAEKQVAPGPPATHVLPVNLVWFGLVTCSLPSMAGERRAWFRFPSKLDPTRNVRAPAFCHERNICMSIGTVKWFNATKGYGFITPDDGSNDVFVHISDVQRSGLQDVREGDKLEFDLQRGQQGKMSATNLKSV
jgi:CspA family cold shock protein